MKNNKIKILTLSSLALLLTACSSGNGRYIETGGADSVISINEVNIGDINKAADSLINDMLSSGAIEATGLKLPTKMTLRSITNRTSERMDLSILAKKIGMALNNSGKVYIVSEDKYTNELAAYQAKKMGKEISLPNLTLTGVIRELRAENYDVREVNYVISMELNYLGKAIWMGEKQISKQASKSAFGF